MGKLRWCGLAAAGMILLASATGCSLGSKGCASVEHGVGVCLDGQPVAWSAGVKAPHMHEEGGYYGGAQDLARALGVQIKVSADKASVTVVGGDQVAAAAKGAKGVHQHELVVFVPIKEFAEAAGYRVQVDTKHNTINIYR